MLNSGKSKTGTKINISGCNNHIYIYPDTILSGTISVRTNGSGRVLWQKTNCTSDDIPFAIEIAKRNFQTDVFEN
jgi:hypothetical protein